MRDHPAAGSPRPFLGYHLPEHPHRRCTIGAVRVCAPLNFRRKTMTSATRVEPLVVGGPVPDFTLSSLDGDPVSLSDYRGRKVVVFMWASW